MSKIMSMLKLKAKIMLGFAAVLLVLLTVSGIGYFSFDKADAMVRSYVRITGNAMRAGDVGADLATLRRHVMNYAYTGEDESYKRAIETEKQLEAKLNEAVAGTKNPERLAAIYHRIASAEITSTSRPSGNERGRTLLA